MLTISCARCRANTEISELTLRCRSVETRCTFRFWISASHDFFFSYHNDRIQRPCTSFQSRAEPQEGSPCSRTLFSYMGRPAFGSAARFFPLSRRASYDICNFSEQKVHLIHNNALLHHLKPGEMWILSARC